ncbi:hypothetical protein [Spiroplasma endosymbiont of Nomada rufipes]|uniref:hypothetical protein n=1 Tax=Spiroplasma endosymbiont of Nomada rufipes TaxID=3077933 RepID=UPI00376EBF69
MKFLYENFLQFYLLALTSIIQQFLLIKSNLFHISLFSKRNFSTYLYTLSLILFFQK